MREIKFRAWDKEAKKMWLGMPSLEFDLLNGKAYMRYPFREVTDDYVFMQYTGLKDKNGVEIYEGDIVRGGTVEDKDGVHDMNLAVEYARGIYEPLAYINKDVTEVIGNIYENPELLNG